MMKRNGQLTEAAGFAICYSFDLALDSFLSVLVVILLVLFQRHTIRRLARFPIGKPNAVLHVARWAVQ